MVTLIDGLITVTVAWACSCASQIVVVFGAVVQNVIVNPSASVPVAVAVFVVVAASVLAQVKTQVSPTERVLLLSPVSSSPRVSVAHLSSLTDTLVRSRSVVPLPPVESLLSR